MKIIYADNAATTRISSDVLKLMASVYEDCWGNASGIYSVARKSKEVLDIARERIARAIGADTSEIFITSCGSEGDNWALKGFFSSA